MEFTFSTITLYTTLLLTGLSAGLFFAWQVSVIPGTKRVKDSSYIETMQQINRAIINPAFMIVFLGPVPMQILSAFLYRNDASTFWPIVYVVILYVIGTVLVTGFGNVPLNDQLDTHSLPDLDEDQITRERQLYEGHWNKLNAIRTAFAVISFGLLLFVSV